MASKSTQKGYSVQRSGNWWCVRTRQDGKLISYNLGIRVFQPKDLAEKVAKEKFGSRIKAKNTTQKISDYNESRKRRKKQYLESQRLSVNIPKFLVTKDNQKTINEYKTHLDFLVSSTSDLFTSKLALKHLYKAQSELREGKSYA